MWSDLPDSLLLSIFMNLSVEDMSPVCCVCHQWSRVGADELLWKNLFYKHFDSIDSSVERPVDSFGYREEAKRLIYHSPRHLCETLSQHTDQVLHVAFAHNGKLFSSCSKDGFVRVWSTESEPTQVKYSSDMKCYSWSYTQFSQFNSLDTLLLVSGVHFGAHTASGEIAVFNIEDDFQLQCRVLNKPYDIFGTWYTNDYLISSRLHFLGHLISYSALWLNKAWQEVESERKPIIKRMFKFYNKNASSIRSVLVADCPTEQSSPEAAHSSQPDHSQPTKSSHRNCDIANQRGNPVSSLGSNLRFRSLQTPPAHSQRIDFYGAESNLVCTAESPIRYSAEYRCEQSRRQSSLSNRTDSKDSADGAHSMDRNDSRDVESDNDFDDPPLPWDEDWLKLSDDEFDDKPSNPKQKKSNHDQKEVKSEASTSKLLCNGDKLLVFTSGSLTYTPHQIGIKRIKPFLFEEFVSETASLSKRLEERRQEKERERETQALVASPNWQEEETVSHLFDNVDYTIDLKGHIIGMALSPDHRYLYVNSRSWPEDAVIEHPLHPPPIAQQIDIHVIDLKTFKRVGNMFRSHKAYTPNDECFFIFLDVCDHWVASGAEDHHGYIWDRHYGHCIAKLSHTNIVNSVAFNPIDSEMLVTASDDNTLKIWRSADKMRQRLRSRRV